jgi:CRP-like cAMP-binding protein
MSEDFSSFAPDLWNALETIVQVRTYDARGVLFEQGRPADGVYMIQKGKVRVWMPERTPRMAVIDQAGAGTLLGLSETIAQGAHKVSATALVPTKVGFVDGEALLKFLRDHHAICLQVVRVLSEDLHVLYHQFQGLKAAHPRARRWQTNPHIS